MAEKEIENEIQSDGDTEPSETTRSGRLASMRVVARRALGWAAEHRMLAGLISGVGAVLIIGLSLILLLTGDDTSGVSVLRGMAAALAALDDGDYSTARQMAEALRASERVPYGEMGGPSFVLGAVAAHQAADKWGEEQVRYYSLAAGHLEQARDRGFPEGRAPEGLYMLGRSLFLSGRIPQSRSALREALKLNRHRESEIHRLLALAYLQDANPKYAEALEHNTQLLADRTLEPDQRLAGVVQRGRILLGMGEVDQCRQTLASLGPRAKADSEALILGGILLMNEARSLSSVKDHPSSTPSPEAVDKYQQAIQLFRQSQGHDRLKAQSTRKAYYLIGVALMEMGNHPAALGQWARTRRVYPNSSEGFAAGLAEAELLRQTRRDDEALIAYHRTLRAIGNPENFSNPWTSLDGLREQLLAAYRDLVDRGSYQQAVELAATLHTLVPGASALLLEAQAYHAWGQAKLSAAEGMDPTEAALLSRGGREHLRQAGMAYASLAKLRITTRDYPDDLWESAENFLAGHDFSNAKRLFRQYLEIEGRRRRPRALVGLAEAQLASGDVLPALESLDDCLRSYPRDAASFQARLWAAKAHVEQGEPDRAAELLSENLGSEHLTPDSREWRESLVELGIVLHHAGRHKAAIEKLSEAVARWPNGPRSHYVRYLLAESYRQRALALSRSLEDEVIPPERIAATREMGRMFEAAVEVYTDVVTRLVDREGSTELTELQRSMQRNSYFARGSLLHQLNRHAEAIQAYTDATNRYQNRPEVLEAYLQIAASYRQLNEPDKARIALRQAQVVLKRLPADAPYAETTNYTSAQWGEMLEWMGSL